MTLSHILYALAALIVALSCIGLGDLRESFDALPDDAAGDESDGAEVFHNERPSK